MVTYDLVTESFLALKRRRGHFISLAWKTSALTTLGAEGALF
jgi:hypothetical protein